MLLVDCRGILEMIEIWDQVHHSTSKLMELRNPVLSDVSAPERRQTPVRILGLIPTVGSSNDNSRLCDFWS